MVLEEQSSHRLHEASCTMNQARPVGSANARNLIPNEAGHHAQPYHFAEQGHQNRRFSGSSWTYNHVDHSTTEEKVSVNHQAEISTTGGRGSRCIRGPGKCGVAESNNMGIYRRCQLDGCILALLDVFVQ